jgi:hypothetical protein
VLLAPAVKVPLEKVISPLFNMAGPFGVALIFSNNVLVKSVRNGVGSDELTGYAALKLKLTFTSMGDVASFNNDVPFLPINDLSWDSVIMIFLI